MIELLVEIKEEVEQQKSNEKDQMSIQLIKDYEIKYQDILNKGRLEDKEKSTLKFNEKGKPQNTESLKLINRLEIII